MMCRTFSSQKGFSLVKFAIFLVIILGFVVTTLSLFPNQIGGKVSDVINQLSAKARSIVNAVVAKVAAPLKKITDWVVRQIEDFKDWWYCYKNPENCKQGGSRALNSTLEEWFQDMYLLIQLAEEQNYKMGEVKALLDRYEEGTASAKRVESEFWIQLQNQTAAAIEKNITRFRTRQLGCSDFTVELKKIWEIEQSFNAESLEGYFVAKYVSNQLHDPRSTEFAQNVFGWLGYENSDWFMEQLVLAIPHDNQSPDYPSILQTIDERMQQARNPLERVIGNITAAEIYLNYELILPAENRFDEALRYLAEIAEQYGSAMTPKQRIGLHMALAFLNERVCKNNDLAIKEFKDAVAIARRQNLSCEAYNDAHYQLGIINLRLREGNQVKPTFAEGGNEHNDTLGEIYTGTPTPTPTATPIPTPTPTPPPDHIKVSIEIPIPRSLEPPETGKARTIGGRSFDMKVVKGEILVPRVERLKPRTELGKTQKMKDFTVDALYDLSSIPDGAIRELEFYLRCSNDGPQVEIARFIHDKYMGK